jgi:hypothetical protein
MRVATDARNAGPGDRPAWQRRAADRALMRNPLVAPRSARRRSYRRAAAAGRSLACGGKRPYKDLLSQGSADGTGPPQ